MTRFAHKQFVDVEGCTLKKLTAKAALIEVKENVDGDVAAEWIPLSQIDSYVPVDAKEGDSEVVVKMAKWIAEDKGFA